MSGNTRIGAQEHRLEDGKFSSVEVEGRVVGAVYEDAARQARDFVAGRIGSDLRLAGVCVSAERQVNV